MLGQHTDLGDFTASKGEPSSFRYHQASSLTLVHDRVTCKWLSRVYVRGTLYLCKVHPDQCMAGVLGAGELFTDGTEIGMNPTRGITAKESSRNRELQNLRSKEMRQKRGPSVTQTRRI